LKDFDLDLFSVGARVKGPHRLTTPLPYNGRK
jgi:hypothetical protein